MSAVDPIHIAGLRNFQGALKEMDGESQKQLRVALNKASDIVVSAAAPKVPRRTGKAAGTVRASSSQREAKVSAGAKKAPYYPWLDFGGRVGRNKSIHRTFIKRGRYIYAAYVREYPRVMDALQDALADVARNSGLEVD